MNKTKRNLFSSILTSGFVLSMLFLTACGQQTPLPAAAASSPPSTVTPSANRVLTTPTSSPSQSHSATPQSATLSPTPVAAQESLIPTIDPKTTQPAYCDQLAETYQPAEGYQTYCDADYLFAFDYPEGWTYQIYAGSPDDVSSSPLWIRRGQVFKAADFLNFIRVDTYHLFDSMSLPERVQRYWSYADRESANKAYPTFTLGGRQAYAIINRYVQDTSAVSLFFQHSEYYTVLELKAIDRSGLDTNWAIARSLQVPGVTPEENVIPQDLIEDSYKLLSPPNQPDDNRK